MQYLLTHSYYAKLLAVRRITQNKGKKTPGIDGEKWLSSTSKMKAVLSLTGKRYKAKPFKRVFINKIGKNKKRPLGIPTMYDRAIQSLYALALKALEERFDSIIMKGIEENPPSLNPERQGKHGKNPKTKARNLLDRFIEYKEPILRFLTDLKVPFENNQAERNIRMMKLQQKISGTFRVIQGAGAFCRIRAYISTLRKNGLSVFEGILAALKGAPLTIP